MPAARFAFCLGAIRFDFVVRSFFFVVVVVFLSFFSFFFFFFLVNQSRTKGEGWSTTNLFKHPSNVIAGRPKAALLCWFVGDFRCGVFLFFVILVIYKYRIKWK